MIDELHLTKIKNGYLLTQYTKGIITADKREDLFKRNVEEVCDHLRENLK